MVAILHMIRFFLLLGIGLAIVPEVGAQSRRKVDAEETGSRIVGRDYERQTNIEGREIILDGIVRHMFPDTVKSSLFVQLDRLSKSGNLLNAGVLLAVDTDSEKVLWYQKVNNEHEELNPIGSIFLSEVSGRTKCYDRTSGKILW